MMRKPLSAAILAIVIVGFICGVIKIYDSKLTTQSKEHTSGMTADSSTVIEETSQDNMDNNGTYFAETVTASANTAQKQDDATENKKESPKTSSSTNSISTSQSSFTNKFGNSTTICAHPGCTNPIASSGDTNCCVLHSKKCAECGKYIDEDAAYCMDCLSKAVTDTTSSNSSNSSKSFSNAYGTATTLCAHPGCTNPIASSGDTNCCVLHSKKCAECGKYIDEDAAYCMDCLTKAVTGTTSSTSSSSSKSFSNAYGSATTLCAHRGCNNPIASSGDTNCCTIHSNRCLECGKYIDEDALYCMSCISKSLQPSNSQSYGSSSNSYGTSSGSYGSSSGTLDFSGYSDSMSDAEFDAWLDDLLGDN